MAEQDTIARLLIHVSHSLPAAGKVIIPREHYDLIKIAYIEVSSKELFERKILDYHQQRDASCRELKPKGEIFNYCSTAHGKGKRLMRVMVTQSYFLDRVTLIWTNIRHITQLLKGEQRNEPIFCYLVNLPY